MGDKPDHDPVSNPSHYTRLDPEPLDVIEAWGLDFHRGQVVKYVARAGYKGEADNELEDLRKAAFYLDRLVAKLAVQAEVPPAPAPRPEGPMADFLRERYPLTSDFTVRMATTLEKYPPRPEPRPRDNLDCLDRGTYSFQPGDCASGDYSDADHPWERDACDSCRRYYDLPDDDAIEIKPGNNPECADRNGYGDIQPGDCSTVSDDLECPWQSQACDSCREYYGIGKVGSS